VIPTITSAQEAYDHIRSMVDRMWSPSAPGEEGVPDEGIADFAVPSAPDPAERARTRLCDSDPLVRIQAAVELGEIGDLEDIGLLSDLLSLPTSPDEHLREREAILHAMQQLSGATQERFALEGVLPATEELDSQRLGPPHVPPRETAFTDRYLYLFFLVVAAALLVFGVLVLLLAWARAIG
jgi:hypothetical protein